VEAIREAGAETDLIAIGPARSAFNLLDKADTFEVDKTTSR
jgi:hypothetical protein